MEPGDNWWPVERIGFWDQPDPVSHARLLEFLAVHHYVRDEAPPLTEALARARVAAASGPSYNRHSILLLDTLRANHLVRQGNIDEALSLYSRILEHGLRQYQEMVSGEAHVHPREVSRYRFALGLLHHNNALLLSKHGRPREAEQQFRLAIAHDPAVLMIRRSLARFYLNQDRWDEAVAALKESYAVSALRPQADDKRLLNEGLAYAFLGKARALRAKAGDGSGEPGQPPQLPASREASSRRSRVPHRKGSIRTFLAQVFGLPDAVGSIPPVNDKDQPSSGPTKAEQVLNDSLAQVDWSEIPHWSGTTHFELATLHEERGSYQLAATHFLAAYDRYLAGKSLSNSRNAAIRHGDVLARFESYERVRDTYRRALEDAGEPKDDPSLLSLYTPELRARVAFGDLACGDARKALAGFHELAAVYDPGDWGPYHESLVHGESLLKHVDVRESADALFHHMLNEADDPIHDRDLTAAALRLYRLERDARESRLKTASAAKGMGAADSMLPVVIPIGLTVSEESVEKWGLDRNDWKVFSEAMRVDFQDRYGVKLPGIRVRADGSMERGWYEIVIHEIPLTRALNDTESVGPCFERLGRLAARNLVEFVGHQEIQNFLERNLIVVPKVEDIAAKENVAHMDPITAVMRALVMERTPIEAPRRFVTSDLRDIHAFRARLQRAADPASRYLKAHLGDALFGPAFDTSKLVARLNRLVTSSDVVERMDLVGIALGPQTTSIRQRGIADNVLLSRLLLEDAFPEAFYPGKMLEYARMIYDEHQKGLGAGLGLADIVESIRRLPRVCERLWGNDGTFTPVDLPTHFESWVEDHVCHIGNVAMLRVSERDVSAFSADLHAAICREDNPVVVVNKSELRPLVSQIVAARDAEVPVLSRCEFSRGADA